MGHVKAKGLELAASRPLTEVGLGAKERTLLCQALQLLPSQLRLRDFSGRKLILQNFPFMAGGQVGKDSCSNVIDNMDSPGGHIYEDIKPTVAEEVKIFALSHSLLTHTWLPTVQDVLQAD
jgi:hypothetical protein